MAKRSKKTSKSRKSSSRPAFLGNAHKAVRAQLRAAVDLPTFLGSAGELTLEQRRDLVEQALLLVQDNYVHLPLKEAMHGIHPVQRLRLMLHRAEEATPETAGSEYAFHREMLEIFNSMRDLHTNYLLPAPFAGTVAFLPFSVEEYFDERDEPRYIASHFIDGFTHAHFKPGVEITQWNGVPIQRAIDVAADEHAGSNLAARHARGLDGLTIRPLRLALPPDAHWVIVGYIDRDGTERETKQDWLVTPELPEPAAVDADAVSPEAASLGLDLELDFVRRTKKMLFAPSVVAAESKKPTKKALRADAVPGQAVPSTMPGTFRAMAADTPSGLFGYVRIFTFNVGNPDAFIDEFVRIVELLPQEGLIIDVRGNGGGHIWASEGLLQTLTPSRVDPEPVQFINTPLNLRISRRHETNPEGIDLGPWAASICESVTTGAVYSRAFPITPADFANARGQRYHGPVVLVTDARCYSATDIFAAGFQDHAIGPVLGVDENTGAGGANVWTHELLKLLLELPDPADVDTPYRTLPQGAGMRVSIRRTLRVGNRAGTPVEDLGVQPDVRYRMSRNDLLNGNQDLINEAAAILATRPAYRLDAELTASGDDIAVEVTTSGLSRVDFYFDGRPVRSMDVEDGRITAPVAASVDRLELVGYDDGKRAAMRKLAV